jgi:hypothetical protein
MTYASFAISEIFWGIGEDEPRYLRCGGEEQTVA